MKKLLLLLFLIPNLVMASSSDGLGLFNFVVSLGGGIAMILCLTNENFPMWQRLIGFIVIIFIRGNPKI